MKRLKILIPTLLFASLFSAFLLVDFISETRKMSASNSLSSAGVLSSETSAGEELAVDASMSLLGIKLTSNQSVDIEVLIGNYSEFSWNSQNLSTNCYLSRAGQWRIRLTNNEPTPCSYRILLNLKQFFSYSVKPHIWMKPFLIVSIVSTIMGSFLTLFYALLKAPLWRNLALIGTVLLAFLLVPPLISYAFQTRVPTVIVASPSMEPAFNVGDLVFIFGGDVTGISTDDVILFDKICTSIGESELADLDTPILHRVVEVYGVNGTRYFKTRGDANNEVDEWYVPEAGVCGRTIFSLPKVGYAMSIIREASFKVLVAVLLTMYLLLDLYTKRRRKQES